MNSKTIFYPQPSIMILGLPFLRHVLAVRTLGSSGTGEQGSVRGTATPRAGHAQVFDMCNASAPRIGLAALSPLARER